MRTRLPQRDALPSLSKPALHHLPLLTPDQASAFASVFKIVANDTRLRLLHALVRAGELCVGDLADAVGMQPQAVSNQLQRPVDQQLLESRRHGNNVYYRIVDPCVTSLLGYGLGLAAEAGKGVEV
jgi:DNA-binding transcriptional ArsR family regulator